MNPLNHALKSTLIFALLAALFHCTPSKPITKGGQFLAEELHLRLTNLSSIHEDTINLPKQLMINDEQSSNPLIENMNGLWCETVVWKASLEIDASSVISLIVNVEEAIPAWNNPNDSAVFDVRRSLPAPTATLIEIRSNNTRLHRYYQFWQESGFILGGFCREAADGYYQESPQAKQWLRHLPEIVEEMARKTESLRQDKE